MAGARKCEKQGGEKTAAKRSKAASDKQREWLVQYMASHPSFASKAFMGAEGKVNHEQTWEKIAETLNKIPGGSIKTVKQWQVVWRDIKSTVSRKGSSNRQDRVATGNRETNRVVPLKPLELHVAQLCGRHYIEGAPELSDSLSENIEDQDRLVAGGTDDTTIVDVIVEANEIYGGELPIYVVNRNDDLNETSDNLDAAPDSPQEVAAADEAADEQAADSEQELTEATPVRVPPRKNVKLRKPSRERIGTQLESAKLAFTDLFSQQNKCLEEIAEALKLQAEASKMNAETSRLQANALQMIAENERARLQLEADAKGWDLEF